MATTARRSLVKKSPARDEEAEDGFPEGYEQFRTRLKIERDNLDQCIEEQPTVFHECFERHVLSTSVRDDCRDELARKDAEIAREFRRTQATAKEKCTDAMCTDAVLLHPEHVKLSQRYARLKRECDLWYSLRESFDHRVKMLKELVALHSQEYYGTTSAGRVGTENRDARGAAGREALNEARRKKSGS